MKTINIKGKPYVEVKEKLKHFRKEYKNYSLQSDIVSLETLEEDGKTTTRVVFKAWITDEEGFTIATGHAYEDKDSTYINKTSFVENCETSAWGRALGCLGIGIETSIASAEEMRNATSQDKPPVKLTITNCCKKTKLNSQKFQAMIVAIANGQEKEVKAAMLKYEIEPAQKNKLNELLTKSKKDVKKTKTSKTKSAATSKNS